MRLLTNLGRVSLLVPLALQGRGEKGHVRISEKEVPQAPPAATLDKIEGKFNPELLAEAL